MRRSAAGRVAAAGSAAPQLWQKRAPGTATVPQTGQVTAGPTAPGRRRFPPQVVELGPHRPLGREPHRRVDVGVDPVDDLLGGVGAGGDGGADLVEPLPPVRAGRSGGRTAVGQRRPVPGQHRAPRVRRTASPGSPGSRPRSPSGQATTVVPRPRMVSPVSTTRSPSRSTRKQTESAVCPGVSSTRISRPAPPSDPSRGQRLAADAVLRVGGEHVHVAEQLGQPGRALDVVVVPVGDQDADDRAVLGDRPPDGPSSAARVDDDGVLARRAPAAPRCWCRPGSSAPGWARAAASPSPAAGRPAADAGAAPPMTRIVRRPGRP